MQTTSSLLTTVCPYYLCRRKSLSVSQGAKLHDWIIFSAFTMLVKWHTKPHAVKRPAKHPRCFHNYKDHHPPLDVIRLLLTRRICFCGLLRRLRLVGPQSIVPCLISILARGLRRTRHPHLDGRFPSSQCSDLRLPSAHLVPSIFSSVSG